MKKTIKKVVLGSATIAAAGAMAQGANAATTNVPAKAVIIDPVQITSRRLLDFGTLTVDPTTGDTFQVAFDSTPTVGANITSIGGTVQSGQFDIKGAVAQSVQVTSPGTIAMSNGAVTMQLTGITIEGGATFTRILAAATETGFGVGGTLNVAGGQQAGTYNGSITLTANYN